MRKFTLLLIISIYSTRLFAQQATNDLNNVLYYSFLNTGTNNKLIGLGFVNNQKGCFLMQKGGCLLTDNGGLTFSISNPSTDTSLNYTAVATIPGKWVVGTQDGQLFYSSNAGVSWLNAFSNAAFQINDISINDNQIAVASNLGKLYITTISGASDFSTTLYEIDSLSYLNFKSVKFLNGFLVLVGNNSKVYFFDYNNNTIISSTVNENITEELVDIRFDNNRGYLLSKSGRIYKSTDAGNSWTLNADFSEYPYWNEIDFNDSLVMAIADSGYVAVSTDFGDSFELYSAGITNNLYGLRAGTGRGYVVGSGGLGMVISIADSTLNLKQLNKYYSSALIYPNPAVDFFRIQNANQLNIKTIEIFDASGRLVKSCFFNPSLEHYPVGDIPEGYYKVIITTENKIISSGLLIKNN